MFSVQEIHGYCRPLNVKCIHNGGGAELKYSPCFKCLWIIETVHGQVGWWVAARADVCRRRSGRTGT